MNRFKSWLIPGILTCVIIGSLVYVKEKKNLPSLDSIGSRPQNAANHPRGFDSSGSPADKEEINTQAKTMSEALLSGNLAACDQITSNETLKQECLDQLHFAAILKKGDEKECEMLQSDSLKAQCYDKLYMTHAIKGADAALCQKIQNTDMKQNCLDQVVFLSAEKSESPDDCGKISSVDLKTKCLDRYYSQSGIQMLDLGSCEQLSQSSLQEECKTVIEQNKAVVESSRQAKESRSSSKKSPRQLLDLCAALPIENQINCKDAVYPQLAFDEKNLAYCDLISDEAKSNQCQKEQGEKIDQYYLRLSLAESSPEMCGKIQNEELRQLCLNS